MYTIEKFNTAEEAVKFYKDNAEDYCNGYEDDNYVYFEAKDKFYELNILSDISWMGKNCTVCEPQELVEMVIKAKINHNIQKAIKELNERIVRLTEQFL